MRKEDIKLQANLSALRRIDPLITQIIDSTSHVALYEYTNNSWRNKNVEGTMFLYGRFYETNDRDRFLEEIIEFCREARDPQTPKAKKSEFFTNAQNDLKDMLNRAQLNESTPRPLSPPALAPSKASKSKSSAKEKKNTHQSQQQPRQKSEKPPKALSSDLERLFSNVKTSQPLKQNHLSKQVAGLSPTSSNTHTYAMSSGSIASSPPPVPHTTITLPPPSGLPPPLPGSGQDMGYPMMPMFPPPSHYMYIPPGALLAAAQPMLAQIPPMLQRDQFRDHLMMLLQSDPPFLETMYNNYTNLARAAQSASHHL